LRSSLKIQADSIVFDLEDGVAVGRKGAARSMVFEVNMFFSILFRDIYIYKYSPYFDYLSYRFS